MYRCKISSCELPLCAGSWGEAGPMLSPLSLSFCGRDTFRCLQGWFCEVELLEQRIVEWKCPCLVVSLNQTWTGQALKTKDTFNRKIGLPKRVYVSMQNRAAMFSSLPSPFSFYTTPEPIVWCSSPLCPVSQSVQGSVEGQTATARMSYKIGHTCGVYVVVTKAGSYTHRFLHKWFLSFMCLGGWSSFFEGELVLSPCHRHIK